MVDVCVETEIRELSPKVFVSLPKEYWDNKITTEAIFHAIAASNDPAVKTEQVIRSMLKVLFSPTFYFELFW